MKKILTIVLSAMATYVMAFDAPTLGWSSWNTFALNISDSVIRSQADAMISTGLAKAGYRNVNIDDGYWDGRDDNGRVRLNDRLFPNGKLPFGGYTSTDGLLSHLSQEYQNDFQAEHENSKDGKTSFVALELLCDLLLMPYAQPLSIGGGGGGNNRGWRDLDDDDKEKFRFRFNYSHSNKPQFKRKR